MYAPTSNKRKTINDYIKTKAHIKIKARIKSQIRTNTNIQINIKLENLELEKTYLRPPLERSEKGT